MLALNSLMRIMRACPKKCVYPVVGISFFIILTIIYGQYHDFNLDRSLGVSWQSDDDSSWTDSDDPDVWNITTATPEETVGLFPLEIALQLFPSLTKKIEGPCSLREVIRKDPLLRKRFSFSVPVLQWAGSFSKPVWQRLRNHAPPYGWNALALNVIRSALALLNGSPSSRLFERRSPDECVRCAVVGNGGILRGSKQGRAIDSHDLVFRVNGAVTRGFEEDVGTKTSFYGFTTNTMKHSLRLYSRDGFTKIPQGPEIRYIFIPSNMRDYVMIAAAIQSRTVTTGEDAGDWPPRYFGHQPSEYFKMLHPDFITYVTQSFLKSPLMSYRATAHLYMPSTGALMLMTALHTCDQVSAYGFITRNYADFSDHYYDSVMKPLNFYANHDMKMESWLWEVLDHRKVMRLYQRTVSG